MTAEHQKAPVNFTTYRGGARTAPSKFPNALGMREMQAQLWQKRGERYLLLKAPPASGKSRALMFVALDKLKNQGLKKCIIVVPERSIGASFGNTNLTENGFWADWEVSDRHNLCFRSGSETSKGTMSALEAFLCLPVEEEAVFSSKGRVLICCHATFRRVFEYLPLEMFDDCFVAVDEFHHVSHAQENVLGNNVRALLARDRAHIMAMTGSFFRGDGEAVLHPEDEAKFSPVSYSYYQQLQSYKYLRDLDLGYYFYETGNWMAPLPEVIDVTKKTIIHIPNVNSSEAGMTTKYQQVDEILTVFGEYLGTDSQTGFLLVKPKNPELFPEGKLLKIVDLVDDNLPARDQLMKSLRSDKIKTDRDYIDVIIALGMAKEGFDWIWAEQAITIGYRNSLTEIVQIIGRVTRDAKGKSKAKFINIVAEPYSGQEDAANVVNELLKAVSVSMLMEQALVPKLTFKQKEKDSPKSGLEVNPETGDITVHVAEIKMPETEEGARIIQEDLDLLETSLLNNPRTMIKALGENTIAQEITIEEAGKIIAAHYPDLPEGEKEAVRQHWMAKSAAIAESRRFWEEERQRQVAEGAVSQSSGMSLESKPFPEKTTKEILIDGIKKWQLATGSLNIDLIESVNPFWNSYKILSKTLNEETFRFIQEQVDKKKIRLTYDEAKTRAEEALRFKRQNNRIPSLKSNDPWEKLLAEGVAAYQSFRKAERQKEAQENA
ncbi:DEAD/DEAH box helicase [Acetobacteraceae bacterium]|nr:DEAD/DEAH box helicase [Acetobacteraceae bacterium]